MIELDVKLINSQTQYSVSRMEDGLYSFETENGIVYEIGFALDNPVGDCETYQFYINSLNNQRPPFDPNVRNVVIRILEDFFDRNESVILYVCDTSDERQRIRSMLFDRWFRESKRSNEFVILSGCLRDEGIDNYASIIIKATNSKIDSVISDFTNTIKLLNENKPN